MSDRMTVRQIRRRKGREKIVAVTAYDYPTARLADEAGMDLILVGDSLGNVVLGHENTLPVTLDDMIHHSKAVMRARPRPVVITDMPYLSFQINPEEAVRNAGRIIKETGVDGVKIERGLFADAARAMVRASIPVVGHVGLAPQSVLHYGGHRVQGRRQNGADAILEEARALEDAGCFAIVLEGIPAALSTEITSTLSIPTIGIGAGSGCDGQIQVFHDLFGLVPEFAPRHARRYAEIGQAMIDGLRRYREDVQAGEFPAAEESFDA